VNRDVTLCRTSLATHSRSFALATRLFDTKLRDDAAVVYAFCRRADDAIDLCEPGLQPPALERLERELASVYDGEAQSDPVLAAFRDVTERRAIPRRYPELLLDGMAMDVRGAAYPDYEALLGYCFRVAGTVGLMMCHVMGVREPRALKHAAHLGIAMQLTNVCRDVHEDWNRGRLYLPDSLLAAFGARHLRARVGTDDLARARTSVASVVRVLLSRADDFYRSGDLGFTFLSFRAALATRTARLVYSDIGRVVRARGCDPFAPRAVVSAPRKAFLALRALVETAGAAGRTLDSSEHRFSPADLPSIGFRDVVPL
jgi:15-cis-phytoene synthase